MSRECDMLGRSAYKVTEGKRPLGKHMCRWEININVYLRIINWIHLAQYKHQWSVLVNTAMNI
jgi:hypothetical protein